MTNLAPESTATHVYSWDVMGNLYVHNENGDLVFAVYKDGFIDVIAATIGLAALSTVKLNTGTGGGTTTTLTEGTDFNRGTTTATLATSLAAAIEATAGFSASVVDSTTVKVRGSSLYSITCTSAGDVTNGFDVYSPSIGRVSFGTGSLVVDDLTIKGLLTATATAYAIDASIAGNVGIYGDLTITPSTNIDALNLIGTNMTSASAIDGNFVARTGAGGSGTALIDLNLGTSTIQNTEAVIAITENRNHDDAGADGYNGFYIVMDTDWPGTAASKAYLFDGIYTGTMDSNHVLYGFKFEHQGTVTNGYMDGFRADMTSTITNGQVRGVDVIATTAQVAGLLYGIDVEMPGTYLAGTGTHGVYVAGDGRTVDLCDNSYAITTSGAANIVPETNTDAIVITPTNMTTANVLEVQHAGKVSGAVIDIDMITATLTAPTNIIEITNSCAHDGAAAEALSGVSATWSGAMPGGVGGNLNVLYGVYSGTTNGSSVVYGVHGDVSGATLTGGTTAAGYFNDAARTVTLANGTNAIVAVGNSVLPIIDTTPASNVDAWDVLGTNMTTAAMIDGNFSALLSGQLVDIAIDTTTIQDESDIIRIVDSRNHDNAAADNYRGVTVETSGNWTGGFASAAYLLNSEYTGTTNGAATVYAVRGSIAGATLTGGTTAAGYFADAARTITLANGTYAAVAVGNSAFPSIDSIPATNIDSYNVTGTNMTTASAIDINMSARTGSSTTGIIDILADTAAITDPETLINIASSRNHDDGAGDALKGIYLNWTGNVPGNSASDLALFHGNFGGVIGAAGGNSTLRGMYLDLTSTLTAGTYYGADIDMSTAAAAGTSYGLNITMPTTYGAATEAAIHATGNGNTFNALVGDGVYLNMVEAASIGLNILSDETLLANAKQNIVASKDLVGAIAADRTFTNYSVDLSRNVDNQTAGNFDITDSAGVVSITSTHTVTPSGGTKADVDTYSGTSLYVHNHATTAAVADALLTATSRAIDVVYDTTMGAASTLNLNSTDLVRIDFNVGAGTVINSVAPGNLNMLYLDGTGFVPGVNVTSNTNIIGANISWGAASANDASAAIYGTYVTMPTATHATAQELVAHKALIGATGGGLYIENTTTPATEAKNLIYVNADVSTLTTPGTVRGEYLMLNETVATSDTSVLCAQDIHMTALTAGRSDFYGSRISMDGTKDTGAEVVYGQLIDLNHTINHAGITAFGQEINLDGVSITDASSVIGLLVDASSITTPDNADYFAGVKVVVPTGRGTAVDANVRGTVSGRIEQGAPYFEDEFHGRVFKPQWAVRTNTGAGGSVVGAPSTDLNGVVLFTTGAAGGPDEMSYDWNDIYCFDSSLRPTIEVRMRVLTNTAETLFAVGLGDAATAFPYAGAAGDNIFIQYNQAAYGNFFGLRCTNGGATSIDPSAVAEDTAFHVFRIEYTSDTAVEWFIDGASQGVIAANVPGGANMQPIVAVWGTNAVARSIEIDYIKIWQDRT